MKKNKKYLNTFTLALHSTLGITVISFMTFQPNDVNNKQ